jgi:hypothetical protein
MLRAAELERFRAKWIPVRVKKTRQIKNLELRFDSIETEKARASRIPKPIMPAIAHPERRRRIHPAITRE